MRSRTDPITAFWVFVRENQDQFRDDKPVSFWFMKRLLRKLDKIKYGMTFEFGQGELSISADGFAENVQIVKAVVAAAPKDLAFKVSAFRQPLPIEQIRHEMAGMALIENDIRIILSGMVKDDEFLGYHLSVYCADLSHANDKRSKKDDVRVGAILILLDHTIGEYNVITKLKSVEFLPLEMAPPGHRPLTDLAKWMDLDLSDRDIYDSQV